jgi:hypothetical protein
VKGDALHAWRSIGFGVDGSPLEQVMPLSDAGLAGLAARERRAIARPSGELTDPSKPRFAVGDDGGWTGAFPLAVAGDVVAVLYADTSSDESADPPAWYDWVETMTVYAGRTLEALTIQLAMGFGPVYAAE